MRRSFRQRLCVLTSAGIAGWLCLQPGSGSANETDNFYLPLDTELADLGELLEVTHTLVLEEVVRTLNAEIEGSLKIKEPRARSKKLDRLHDPGTLAEAVVARFGHALLEDNRFQKALRGKWAARAYPGKATSHYNMRMNFAGHFLLDPRKYGMLYQSHTVRACGVYFGTDKIVHFHHLGVSYYRMYRSLLKHGLDAEQAYQEILDHHIGQAFFAEKTFFGTMGTGIYSNADMASNLAGFKFFLNLTEPGALKGKSCAPLLVRNGVFWRVNQHVRPRSGWFCDHLSDHWNEALNPSLYVSHMRAGIRRVLSSWAQHIVQFYTERDGRPNDPAYFDNLARELSTYFGEPYGHSGQFEKLMTVGNTCVPALLQQGTSRTP